MGADRATVSGATTARDLREELATQTWTLHNLWLPPGVWTMPTEPEFTAHDPRWRAVRRTLRALYPFPDQLAGQWAVDLGCLEGGFSVALAGEGAITLGVEARPEHFAKLLTVQRQLGQAPLQFLRADVKHFVGGDYGQFDIALAMGILYHLDDPVLWLRQLAAITRRVLIIDTHFAPEDDADPCQFNLGPLTTERDGVPGRWYREYAEGTDPATDPWAAYSNARSFWLTKRGLLHTLENAGFNLVWEQHDYPMTLPRQFVRMLAVAVKED